MTGTDWHGFEDIVIGGVLLVVGMGALALWGWVRSAGKRWR